MKLPSIKIPKIHFGRIKRNATHNKRIISLKESIKRKPFTAFAITLIVLLGLIIIGNVAASLSKKEEKPKALVRNVQTYKIGDTAKVTYQGQVENSGVVTIVAQSGGVVQQINLTEGQPVAAGQTLVSLSSNYQGGNAPALQSQLAQAQLKNVLDTFDTQRDLINKQREQADQTNVNAQQLTTIQNNSIDDLQATISTNDAILTTLYTQLAAAQQAGNAPLVLQLQQGIAQVQGGLTQLNTQLQTSQYQVTPTNPPTQLNNLQKDITKKQLDVQEKGLELSKTSAQIQANIAAVNAALMAPASPVQGTVERIHVHVGESVQPGAVIATISGVNKDTVVNVLVPSEVAFLISRTEPSTITIGNGTVKSVPYYVSSVPTSGQLYSALYSVPANDAATATEGGYIAVEIPLNAEIKRTDPYVPIDSVYQTQESAYVYVVSDKKVKTKEVTLGSVFGQYAQILKGLADGDEIILNRNVVAGEKVKVTKTNSSKL
jgi:multidrug efflux pump subunit AcrA (membrane-fusion protein)